MTNASPRNELAIMCDALGMEAHDDNVRLWHVLFAAIEHCDRVSPRLDFAAVLAQVMSDYQDAQYVDANVKAKTSAKREPQVSMMIGGMRFR